MISKSGAKLLPPPTPNVSVNFFPVVAAVDDFVDSVVDAVVIFVVIFGEVVALIETIKGLPYVVLVPVGPSFPKPPDLRFLTAALSILRASTLSYHPSIDGWIDGTDV